MIGTRATRCRVRHIIAHLHIPPATFPWAETTCYLHKGHRSLAPLLLPHYRDTRKIYQTARRKQPRGAVMLSFERSIPLF